MKKMRNLMMYALAGTLIFSACKKDDDPEPSTPADSTAPTMTLDSPTDNSTINAGSMLKVEGTAKDNKALKHVQVKLMAGSTALIDSSVAVTGTEAAFQVMIPVPAASVGAHTLTVMAVDVSDNESTAETRTITVRELDAIDPVVKSITVKTGGGKLQTNFDNEVELHVTDNKAIKSISLELWDKDNNKSVKTYTVPEADITNPLEFKKVIIFKFNGTFQLNTAGEWRAKVKDSSGNEGTLTKAVTIEQ